LYCVQTLYKSIEAHKMSKLEKPNILCFYMRRVSGEARQRKTDLDPKSGERVTSRRRYIGKKSHKINIYR
jgi:hypothetical protein